MHDCEKKDKKVLSSEMLSPTLYSMKLKEALEIIGGLSKPSKMPGHGWSISAKRCKTGSKLRKVKGSVCEKCYALKGRYPFPNVQNAMERRFAALSHPQWVEAMTVAIGLSESSGYMRLFDSGDIQSVEMLEKIVQIANNLPQIRFWLPTREYGIVSEYVKKNGAFPENLTVRLSSYMIDGQPPTKLAERLGCVTSGVTKNSFTCPASNQGNKCLSCRACWHRSVSNVNYRQH
jgi:hypothetical protein